MNSKNSKTSDNHRLLFNLSEKNKFKKRSDMLLYQILPHTIHGRISKSNTKIINLKYQLRNVIKNLNFLYRYSRLF